MFWQLSRRPSSSNQQQAEPTHPNPQRSSINPVQANLRGWRPPSLVTYPPISLAWANQRVAPRGLGTPPWAPPSAFHQFPLRQSGHSLWSRARLPAVVNLCRLANQRAAKHSAPPPQAHVSGREAQGRPLGVAAATAAAAAAATTTAAVTAVTAASEAGPGGRWGRAWSPRPPELPTLPLPSAQVSRGLEGGGLGP